MDSGIEKRRSPRVSARIPIQLIVGGDPPTHALTAVVNRHGALILSSLPSPAETILWVRNDKSEANTRCRVVWVGAPESGGTHKIGLEFIDPAPGFWGAEYEDALAAEAAL